MWKIISRIKLVKEKQHLIGIVRMAGATQILTKESIRLSSQSAPRPEENGDVNGRSVAVFTDLIRPDLHDYSSASNLAFNEKVKNFIAKGRKIHHFGFGQTPFPIDTHFTDALKEHAGALEYLPVAGLPVLREAIVKFHERFDKLHFEPDQVIVGPGTKELILLMMTVFNGDVMLPSPSWTTYSPQAKLSRHKTYAVNTSEETNWKMTSEALEETIVSNNLKGNKVLIMCNPCNPTGVSYNASELTVLSKTLRKHNVIVLSDEIYARLHYEQDHKSLAKFYPEGTILSTGMSKWASAGGWRLGYHIYPKELKALQSVVISSGSHSYSCAAAPQQYAVAKALGNLDACHSYILHTSRVMSAVGQFCTKELREAGLKVTPPCAGYYMFPNFEVIKPALAKRGIYTGKQMCDALFDEANVALLPGGPDHLRPVDELTVRLCYVCFDGSDALAQSKKLGLDVALPEDFVHNFCTPIYDGIKAIQEWVKKQQ